MSHDQVAAPDLARRIRSIVWDYVRQRTERKCGISWESFKDDTVLDPATGRKRLNVPPKYANAYEQVCQEAFLRLRGCRSREDFVPYFTGTICSVPQFLPEPEYLAVTTALLDRGDAWEDMKSLAMLALSGFSRI